MKTMLGLLVVCAVGCASNSGIVPMGSDTYMVSRQAATGFTGMGTLKAEAMKEAYEQCQKTGKSVQVLEAVDAKPCCLSFYSARRIFEAALGLWHFSWRFRADEILVGRIAHASDSDAWIDRVAHDRFLLRHNCVLLLSL